MAKQVQLEIGDCVNIYGKSINPDDKELVLYLMGIYMGNGFVYIHEKVDVNDPSLYIHNIKDVKYWDYIVPVDMVNSKYLSVKERLDTTNIFKYNLVWANFKIDEIQDADTPDNCKLKDYAWFKKIQKIIAEKFA